MSTKNNRAVVFGGAGFIGSVLCSNLVSTYGPIISLSRSIPAKEQTGITHHKMFFEDIQAWKNLIFLSDVVYFLIPFHKSPIFESKESDEQYLRSFKALLDICVEKRVKKFIFLSSGGSIYGNTDVPASEELLPQPISAYGKLKLKMEGLITEYRNNYKLPSFIARASNVYGGCSGAVGTFHQRIKNNQCIKIFGNLEITKDYLHIEDLIPVLIQAGNDSAVGLYNIGYGKSYPLSHIINCIESKLGKKAKFELGPAIPGDINRYFLDCSLAKEKLNFSPKIDLEEGISKYL